MNAYTLINFNFLGGVGVRRKSLLVDMTLVEWTAHGELGKFFSLYLIREECELSKSFTEKFNVAYIGILSGIILHVCLSGGGLDQERYSNVTFSNKCSRTGKC